MTREGEVAKSAKMTIRVYFPNPLPKYPFGEPLDSISILYEVSYLEKLDPIYHELAFIDMIGVRHQFVGLAYHVEETMPSACDVDSQI
ncbi:MAG: hypothetical protein WA766_14045 [Candidatus Acidiferrales bacterium]